ncbi:glycosyltransferase 87 family protein [Angustibacter aerolatus]
MRRLAPTALLLLALGALLLVGTAALGPSAAEPSLAAGSVGPTPPWTLGLHPSSALVTVLLDVGYLVGAIGVLLGWLAARRGEVLPRWAVPAGLAVAALAVLVPPLGSADHVNYAAYGRIAAGGGDPYVVAPIGWAGGHDPVTSAVEAPWTTTPSIYGPVATLVQLVCSLVGGDSLRLTVWVWQLVCLASWVAVCRLATSVLSGPARERAAWLWPLNPVLLGLLVVGAHVDLLAAALGLGAVVLCARRPLVAGVLLGAAVGVKLTAALLGPAVLYALWRSGSGRWRAAGLGVLGAALVLVPAHLWAGPHVLDQLSRARRFVSLATPWRPLVDALTGPLPNATVRTAVVVATPLAVLLCAWLVARVLTPFRAPTRFAHLRPLPAAEKRSEPRKPGWDAERGGAVVGDAALAAVVLGAAYVLAAPYSLPWYDALAWAPLLLVAATPLDLLLLVRLVAYAVAYVPGRVEGVSQGVTDVTLGYRRGVTPWIGLAVLLGLVVLGRRRAGTDESATSGRS